MSANVNSTLAESLPQVAVLLATHNGAAYIEAQLASLARQVGVRPVLHWGDDGSTDDTVTRLRAALTTQHLAARAYPLAGGSAAQSFLALVAQADSDAEYYAFCDQDDVWHADKLQRAVAALAAGERSQPALYCARTIYADAALTPCGESPLWPRAPGFCGALAQNIAAGNTIVMNRAAFNVLRTVADLPSPAHDWTAYLAVSALGGRIVFDPQPCLLYRQHGANVVGAGAGMGARWRRIGQGLAGRHAAWNQLNCAMLQRLEPRMAAPQRAALQAFREACQDPAPLRRVLALRRSGVYRMTLASQVLLYVAACVGGL